MQIHIHSCSRLYASLTALAALPSAGMQYSFTPTLYTHLLTARLLQVPSFRLTACIIFN